MNEEKYEKIQKNVKKFNPKIPSHMTLDDVTQEVAMKLFRNGNIDWYSKKIDGYIRSTIYSVTMTMWRKEKKKKYISLSEIPEAGYIDLNIEDFEL